MVNSTNRVTRVLDVDLDVAREQEKRLLVYQHLIVYVPKIHVLVPMVQLLQELLVQHTVPTFVPPVMVDITKVATPVLDVDLLVVREREKHLLVHRHPIVDVPKTYVHVPVVQL